MYINWLIIRLQSRDCNMAWTNLLLPFDQTNKMADNWVIGAARPPTVNGCIIQSIGCSFWNETTRRNQTQCLAVIHTLYQYICSVHGSQQCSAFLCYKTVCFALFKGSTLEILSIFITHMSCFMGIVRSWWVRRKLWRQWATQNWNS